MTPTERRQVAALLRRAAQHAEHETVIGGDDCSICGGIVRYGNYPIRYYALREWDIALPRNIKASVSRRVLLALMLSAAIEAGDLP